MCCRETGQRGRAARSIRDVEHMFLDLSRYIYSVQEIATAIKTFRFTLKQYEISCQKRKTWALVREGRFKTET